MKQFFGIVVIISTLNFKLIGQTDSSKWKLKVNDCKAALGYFYQGEHFMEGGFKIDFTQNNSRNYQNISLIPGGQLTKHDKNVYVNPFVMLRYFKPLNKKVSVIVSASYNYRKILNIASTSITPEFGINLNHIATISYGYNIFIDNKYDWTLPHRIAFRLMLH